MNQLITVLAIILCCGYCTAKAFSKFPSEEWKTAVTARKIIHSSEWVSIATISSREIIKGYPYAALKSMSDGTLLNSSGIPYLYVTDLDVSSIDLQVDNRIALMASLAQGSSCQEENLDPQDPRCARVMITGQFSKVPKDSDEYKFGQGGLFSRHPSMRYWPPSHGFYVAKIDPVNIDVMDNFGGLKHVTKEMYFAANITNMINAGLQMNSTFLNIESDIL